MTSELTHPTPGHAYRVGKRWFVDTARLAVIARRSIVEPMRGGYQILARSGLIRCTPVAEAPLPDQAGVLYQCLGADDVADLGARLQRLADDGAPAREWETWPTGPGAPASAGCGCDTCTAGETCPCKRKGAP